jgi:hypothetical protein
MLASIVPCHGDWAKVPALCPLSFQSTVIMWFLFLLHVVRENSPRRFCFGHS